MNYLSELPSELITVLSDYLNFTETCIIRELFDVKVDYHLLLSKNYPGWYELIQVVKKHDVKYENMIYEKAYDLINLLEIILRTEQINKAVNEHYAKINTNLSNNKPGDISSIIYEFNIMNIADIENIVVSYNMITNTLKQKILYKYNIHFPNLNNLNTDFIMACDEYYSMSKRNDYDQIFNIFDDETITVFTFDHKLGLIEIFLFILDKPELIGKYKDKIINLKIPRIFGLDIESLILYQYILDYLKLH
jgi:hypothetical protein